MLPPCSRSSWPAYGSTAFHMLKVGFSALHMPEVNDIARTMSRKFSGSWNGSARTTSPNSVAKSRSSRGSTCCSSESPMPPKRANSWVIACSSWSVSADGSSTPTSRMLSTSPLPSREATAIISRCSPLRRLSVTSPIMPKSMNVRVHARPPAARPRRRRSDEDVARMRVGVEIPVREELVEHHGCELGRHLRRVDTRGAERVEVIDLDCGDVGQRQHPPRRALPDDLWRVARADRPRSSGRTARHWPPRGCSRSPRD